MRVLRFIVFAFIAAVAAFSVAGSLGGHTAFAGPGPATVLPGQGVTFAQVDYTWSGATTLNSNTGDTQVDISPLQTATGLLSGFLNVETADGWVVQNLPVFSAYSYPQIEMAFELSASSSPGNVASLNAYVEFSPVVVTSFVAGPFSAFPVGDTAFNGEGVVSPVSAYVPAPPVPGLLNFNAGGPDQVCIQLGHNNIETAHNQCAPAASANSFDWLRTTYGINLGQVNNVDKVNKPGLGCVDAPIENPNALVTQLDATMMRTCTSRRVGNPPSSWANLLQGKLCFIRNKNLGDLIDVKHQSLTGVTGVPGGNVSFCGLTSRGYGEPSWANRDFLISAICKGKDVEMSYAYPGGGAHSVNVFGAGYVKGVPFILSRSDHDQNSDTSGLFQGANTWDAGYLYEGPQGPGPRDGTLRLVDTLAGDVQIVDVMTESPKAVNGTPIATKTQPAFTPTITPTPTRTRTPTPTPTSTPGVMVGGVSLDPQIPGSSGGDAGLLAGVMAAALAGAVALGGGVWYARRRRVH